MGRLTDFISNETMPVRHDYQGYPTQEWRESMMPVWSAHSILLSLEAWLYRTGPRPIDQDYSYRDKNDNIYLAQMGRLLEPMHDYLYELLNGLGYTCQDVVDLKDSITADFKESEKNTPDTWEYLFLRYLVELNEATEQLEAA